MRYGGGMSNPDATRPIPATRDLIAANVDAEFTRKRWSKRRAAIALGMSHVYISRRTSGEVEMSGSDLVTFAQFLSVPVRTFFVGLPDLDSNQEPAGYTLEPTPHWMRRHAEHNATVLRFRPRAS